MRLFTASKCLFCSQAAMKIAITNGKVMVKKGSLITP